MRHSLRLFRKSPGFTITAVAALALGIGGASAIFSLVNAVLLRPLGIPHIDRVVILFASPAAGSSVSPAKFLHFREEHSILQDVSAFLSGWTNFNGSGTVEQWSYTRVSEEVFHCFGIRVLKGRTFTSAETLPGAPLAAVISQSLWRRRFSSDPDILGRKISLNGEPHTIIGVVADSAAARDAGPFNDLYVPLQIDPASIDQGDLIQVAARLKAGVTLGAARARLRSSAEEYRTKYPGVLEARQTFTATTFREDLVGGDRPLLLILAGAFVLVLLIACANVANLLLARAAGRKREMAVRMALGAGRGMILRQLLAEALLLSLAGGGMGLLLGFTGVRALLAIDTAGLPLVGPDGAAVTLDWRVVAFTLAISVATALLFGLLPALQGSSPDLASGLRDNSGSSGTQLRRNRGRAALVVSEVAFAVVLLIAAALLMRSFVALYAVKPGFDAKNVITMNVLFAGPKYNRTAGIAETVRDGLERVRAIPGVVSAGATCCMPLDQGTFDMDFQIAGRPPMSGPDVGWATISPGYFETFRIPLKRGRAFNSNDDARSPAVAIISERLAREYWKDGDPLGQRITIGHGASFPAFANEPMRQIVGIAADIRSEGLDSKPRPILYVPQAQLPDAASAYFTRLLPMAFLIRTQAAPRLLVPAVRTQLTQATGLPVTGISSMEQVIWAQTARQRFSLILMGVFGGAALLLAAIGVYGLMAYTVEQRRQEIGIRMALGAEAAQVRKMVVREGMSLAIGGVAAGLGAAWGLSRWIASLLFGVRPHDPMVFLTAPLVLALVALAAVCFPAHRASRVDPMDALRHQ